MASSRCSERIDFISEYCDRWCERCAFTLRCSAFAIDVATAMCDGDFEAGVELAVGPSRQRDDAEAAERSRRIDEMNAASSLDADALTARDDDFERRVEASPVSVSASTLKALAWTWLRANEERVRNAADPVLREAMDVASWDAAFVGAKLHRGLIGLVEFAAGVAFDDHSIQNDWNGSAKVALLSIDRSIDAWTTIGSATSDDEAWRVRAELTQLKAQVETAFPDARRFRRPGFDTLAGDNQ
jgi:hypothetical protein